MKKLFVCIISISLLVSSLTTVSGTEVTHWAYPQMQKLMQYNVIQGYADGQLAPDRLITRAELAQVLTNLFKYGDSDQLLTFSDVESGAWYYSALQKAVDHGLFKGYPDGRFKPDRPVTREEAFSVLYDAFYLDTQQLVEDSDSMFKDYNQIQPFARKAIVGLEKAGYINGYEDQTIQGHQPITRGEVAHLINEIVDLYIYEPNQTVKGVDADIVLVVGENAQIADSVIRQALFVTEAIGESDFTLASSEVENEFYIEGGGQDSIYVIDSIVNRARVNKKMGGQIRLVIEGKTSVKDLRILSGMKLENKGTDNSILDIIIEETVTGGSLIEFLGSFDKVNLLASNLEIVLDGAIRSIESKGSNQLNNVVIGEGVHRNKSTEQSSSNNTKRSESTSPWTLVWHDEFNGDSLDTQKWAYETGNWIVDGNGNGIAAGWGNNEKQYYTGPETDNVRLENGMLVLEAKIEATTDEYGSYDYTSGKLVTNGLFDKAYGKFEARMKLPQGQGLWPAFWMMPKDSVYGGWAASGEIDIMEAAGSDTSHIGGTIHYGEVWPNNTYNGSRYTFEVGTDYTDFHTYAVEWEPGEIRWYVDDELYFTENSWYSRGENSALNYAYPAPFDQPFYMILNLAVGGWYDGDPQDQSIFPAQALVDYVRVYELTGRDYRDPIKPDYEPEALPADAKLPLADGNLIYNNQFDGTNVGDMDISTLSDKIHTAGIDGIDNTEYWYLLTGFSGEATASIDALETGERYAKVDIAAPGEQNYAVQLIQDVSLASGNYYQLTFDAKASADRPIAVKIGGDGNDGDAHGWTAYTAESFELTTDMQSYEYTFLMDKDTDVDARLEFNLGLNENSVWIGNAMLKTVEPPQLDEAATKPPLSDGNRIYNGTFDQGDTTLLTYWTVTSDQNMSSALVEEEIHKLQINLSEADPISVIQKGIQLNSNAEYTLEFDAQGSGQQTVTVKLISNDGSTVYSLSDDFDLTDEEARYQFVSVMNEASDMNSQIELIIAGEDGVVTIDNIRLTEKTDYLNVTPDVSYLFKEAMTELDGVTGYCDALNNTQVQVHKTAKDGEESLAFIHQAGSWGGFFVQLSESVDVGDYENLVVSIQAPSTIESFEIKPEGLQGPAESINLMAYEPVANGDWQTYTIPLSDFSPVDFSQFKVIGFWNPMDSEGNFVDAEILIDELYFDGTQTTDSEVDTTTGAAVTLGFDTITFEDESQAWSGWWGDEWNGFGEGTINVTGGAMVVDVTSPGALSFVPQVFYEGFGLENGETYEVSFDVYSSVERQMNVNIGKALTADPWFINYAPVQTVGLTTTSSTVTYEFTVTDATDDHLKMVFELGKIGDNAIPATVYFDNIAIIEKIE